jgi:hypothetical protein
MPAQGYKVIITVSFSFFALSSMSKFHNVSRAELVIWMAIIFFFVFVQKRQPGETSGERLNGLVGESDRPGHEAESPISLGNRLVQHQNSFGSSNVTDSQNNGVNRHGSDVSNDFRPSDHRSLFKRVVSLFPFYLFPLFLTSFTFFIVTFLPFSHVFHGTFLLYFILSFCRENLLF